MFGAKVLLSSAALSAVICAVIMIWNLESFSCDVTIAKVLMTMFVICAVILTNEATKL